MARTLVRAAGTVLVVMLLAGAVALGASALDARTSATTVRVVEKEWSITASPKSVKAGKVTFVVRNAGKLAHEFVVIRTSRPAGKLPVKGPRAVETGRVGRIPQFKPGQTRRLTLTLKRGKYALICNLAAHYKAGQYGSFQVS